MANIPGEPRCLKRTPKHSGYHALFEIKHVPNRAEICPWIEAVTSRSSEVRLGCLDEVTVENRVNRSRSSRWKAVW